MPATFIEMFRKATGGHLPYPYQSRLAGLPHLPELLHVPTGAGKTLAAFHLWLYRRRFHPDPSVREGTPRRLVYCLPMRVLVHQTVRAIREQLERLGLAEPHDEGTLAPPQHRIPVFSLLGGEIDDAWLHLPEADAVIVGTQDLLVSRALNRGYAMSRFRWPVAFGLLNNDALWVFDEVQLAGASLPTSRQLQAFRNRLKTIGPAHTLWMSATLQPAWFATVDNPAPEAHQVFTLDADDHAHPLLKRRLEAKKILHKMPGVRITRRPEPQLRSLATFIRETQEPGTLTLVVVNTVQRAIQLYNLLHANLAGNVPRGTPSKDPAPDIILLHSRFRPPDREEKVRNLLRPLDLPGRIVVSTQVVEAGVDVSAHRLFTELAPWPSIVQRLGRCNRDGRVPGGGVVYWIDVAEDVAAPYEPGDLAHARDLLDALEGQSAAPAHLPNPAMPMEQHDTLRMKDLLELFDTTPDLSGNDIDVSRFVRDHDQVDTRVFWRRWEGDNPNGDGTGQMQSRPGRDELCPVPTGELRRFLTEKRHGWVWDQLSQRWIRLHPAEVRPGQVVMLAAQAGGYHPDVGWNLALPGTVEPLAPKGAEPPPEGMGSDDGTYTGTWQTIEDHSRKVMEICRAILDTLADRPLALWREALLFAAAAHDIGKALPVFQETLLSQVPEPERSTMASQLWAKSAAGQGRHRIPHFRHELASLLALLHHAPLLPGPLPDLAAYLVGAHHGRIRLGIRSYPRDAQPIPDGEAAPESPPAHTGHRILGVAEGDLLPPVTLGNGLTLPETRLSLEAAAIGERNGQVSWLQRSLHLLETLGPFRLAYFEAILRAADVRASRGSSLNGMA